PLTPVPVRARTRRRRVSALSSAGACALLAGAVLASGATGQARSGAGRAQARADSHLRSGARPARHLSLSLPSSAMVGARVRASGAVGTLRGRRVVLQNRSGRRWRVLAAATVRRRRFAFGFTAPRVARVLTLRAVLYRGRHAVRASKARRL